MELKMFSEIMEVGDFLIYFAIVSHAGGLVY